MYFWSPVYHPWIVDLRRLRTGSSLAAATGPARAVTAAGRVQVQRAEAGPAHSGPSFNDLGRKSGIAYLGISTESTR